jgi:HlyD family secretion protein
VVVRINLWHGKGLTAVPVGALFRQGAAWACYTVNEGAAHMAQLELGERNADFAEVKRGLTPGETVILHPGDAVQEGVRVAYSDQPH